MITAIAESPCPSTLSRDRLLALVHREPHPMTKQTDQSTRAEVLKQAREAALQEARQACKCFECAEAIHALMTPTSTKDEKGLEACHRYECVEIKSENRGYVFPSQYAYVLDRATGVVTSQRVKEATDQDERVCVDPDCELVYVAHYRSHIHCIHDDEKGGGR